MTNVVCKTIENETKYQKRGFISILLRALGVSLLRNLVTVKGIIGTGEGKTRFLMLPHPSTNFKIQRYQKEPIFNGVYSRNK